MSFLLFFISPTASIPEGVAPLPSPKKFAEIFVIMLDCAFSFPGRAGKKLCNQRPQKLRRGTHAACVFKDLYQATPKRYHAEQAVENLTASSADVKMLCATSLILPVKIPVINPARNRSTQIIFNMMRNLLRNGSIAFLLLYARFLRVCPLFLSSINFPGNISQLFDFIPFM